MFVILRATALLTLVYTGGPERMDTWEADGVYQGKVSSVEGEASVLM